MKNLHTLLLSGLMMAALGINVGHASGLRGPRAATVAVAAVDVTLQNKCTRDVKYSVRENGQLKNGVVAKGDKLKLSVGVGAEICIDGEHFLTVAATDAGKTLVVCQ